MFVGIMIVGNLPLFFSLKENSIKLFQLYGVGLLLGAALSVILPEGVEAVYGAGTEQHHGESDEHDHTGQSRYIALALLGGFITM